MKPPRFEAIDVARGLAALSVAAYHHGFGNVLAQISGWQPFELLNWPGAVIAVPFFFVISGFCIHLGWLAHPPAPEFARRFFLQRFFRIYPPWLVAVLLSALVLWLDGQPPGPRLLLTHLTLTNGFFDDYRLNAALWSVSVESFLYLLYPFWLSVRRRHGLPAAVILAGGVSAASCAVTARFFSVPTGPSMWFFLNVWCGWVAGTVLAELSVAQQGRTLRLPAWWFGGAILIGLHLVLLVRHAYIGAWAFVRLPISICLCIWPLALLLIAGERISAWNPSRPAVRLWRLFARIGIFSYSLYLLHIPLQTLRFSVNAWLPDSPIMKGLLLVSWFAAILGVSWLCYRWIEEPSARLGRRLAGRLFPPAA